MEIETVVIIVDSKLEMRIKDASKPIKRMEEMGVSVIEFGWVVVGRK